MISKINLSQQETQNKTQVTPLQEYDRISRITNSTQECLVNQSKKSFLLKIDFIVTLQICFTIFTIKLGCNARSDWL